MACQAMATVIRTPFLYLASYIPAATVMMMPGQFKRAAMDGWVVDGTITVMKFQKQMGAGTNWVVDRIVNLVTDLCDSDFYFLVLPALLWFVDIQLGRWLTILTTLGVSLGGVLKDIYRLPRPPPLLVWRDFAAGDSTGAKDFGFVSTHTANAVTNSFGLLLFALHRGWLSGAEPLILLGWTLLALAYPVIIGASRLYLGLHTPLDVIGGASLGAVLVVVGHSALPRLDALLDSSSVAEVAIAVAAAGAFFGAAHPQARPHTVTFLHDMELFGLALSSILGTKILQAGFVTDAAAAALPGWQSVGPSLRASGGTAAFIAVSAVVGFSASGAVYLSSKIVGPALVRMVLGIDAKAVRRQIERAPSTQRHQAAHVAVLVVRRLEAEGDPLDLLAPGVAAEVDKEARRLTEEEEEQRPVDDISLAEPALGDSGRSGPSSLRNRRSVKEAAAKTEKSLRTGAAGVSLAEVPITVVPDEPAWRGVELGACAFLKLFTYVSTGVGICAVAPAMQSVLGLCAIATA